MGLSESDLRESDLSLNRTGTGFGRGAAAIH